MAEFFSMPVLGQTMEEGTILRWFKQEGDVIKKGEPLLEVMSDKANIEVESPCDGVLRKILVAADEMVPVKTPIAIIGTADEPIDALLSGGAGAAGQAGDGTATPATVEAPVSVEAAVTAATPPTGRIPISPRARRLADERGIPIAALAGIAGSGPQGRILEKDVLAYLEKQAAAPLPTAVPEEAARPRLTPLAARIADELGVKAEELARGLPGGRVRAEDVLRAAETARPVPPPVSAPAGLTVTQVIPFKGLRKMIADNVTKTRQTVPHVSLTMEVDVTELVALHARLQPEIQKVYNTKLTYTDLIIKATARALADHPLCNAALIGDEIRLYAEKNIGVAVATEAGLIVPVIKSADRKPLGEISVELKALAERCRTGKQTPEDLAGGTFTITNLGAFGIDNFDPILVSPQSCILGVCRIAEKPAVIDKQVVVRSMMNLCLSFDHRVLDGVPGSRFLQRLKELLESPLLILV